MVFVRLIPIFISAILLAAHFMRFYGLIPALIIIALLFLLIIRNKIILRIWQGILFIGVLIWIETTVNLIHLRISMNMDWFRLATIMISVILFTIFSGFWMENKKIKNFYEKKN